jgi:hypothetical protein
MHIARRFTTAGQDPYGSVSFRNATSESRNPDGAVEVFDRMVGTWTYLGWKDGDGMY